jgi:hypothetical protein
MEYPAGMEISPARQIGIPGILRTRSPFSTRLDTFPAGGVGAIVSSDEDKIRLLWEERQIEKVMLRFGRSLDTGDWVAYRSCFTDLVNIDFKRLTGFDEVRLDAHLWTEFARLFQTPLRRQHAYSNFDVKITRDAAHAIVYFAARCWRATDMGAPHYVQYGWYEVWFERRQDDWLINRLRHDLLWIEGNAGVVDAQEPELAKTAQAVFSSGHIEAARAYLSAV